MTKAIALLALGGVACFGSQWANHDYEAQAVSHAEAYAVAHLSDFKPGDLLRVRDDYLAQKRLQRANLYALEFGGFILACCGASSLRQARRRP